MRKWFLFNRFWLMHAFNNVRLCSLAVALIVIPGWTAVASASNYFQLAQQALVVHENARQSIRGPLSEKRIADAVKGFRAPFDTADALKAKPIDFYTVRDVLRSISAHRDVLQSVIDRAQMDDDMTVRGVVVYQSAARALADKQKVVDQQFLTGIDGIIGQIRQDLATKGGG